MAKSPRRSRRKWSLIILLVLVTAAVGAWAFQPWKLFIDASVNEAVPSATVLTPAADTPTSAPGPIISARGTFIGHEHDTSGEAQLLELPDGSRYLRIENLDTSNGPALHVWLSDAPVIEGKDGWFVFDDGRHEDLGELKGNQGSANYLIPARVDLTGLTSVSVWCERFHVSFGAARLDPL